MRHMAMHQWVAMRNVPCGPDASAGTAVGHLAYRSANVVVPDPLPIHVAGAALVCRAQPCSYVGASDVRFTAGFAASFQDQTIAQPPVHRKSFLLLFVPSQEDCFELACTRLPKNM